MKVIVKKFISEKLRPALEVAHKKSTGTPKECTKIFHTQISKLATRENELISYSSFIKGGGRNSKWEFLVDLCLSKEVYRKRSWDKDYNGLFLICESEWSSKKAELIFDFQKLGVIKAEIKLFIFPISKKADKKYFGEIVKTLLASLNDNLLNDGSYYCFFGSGHEKEGKFSVYYDKIFSEIM